MTRRLREEQEGFTILEVVIAMTVLALASVGFATTAGGGLRLVGTSNERQTAVQVANESMETARATPFSGLALDSATVFDGAGTPDEALSGTTYEGEELVLEPGGAFDHRSATDLNGASYATYRYVTWVVDGADAQAYKRVTIVVQWDGGDADGVARRVTQSTIISSDGVSWVLAPLESGGGVPPTTTTTAPETTTTTAPPVCDGDVTPPTGNVTILAGTGANTGYTSSSTANLSLTSEDACGPIEVAFSNDAGASWSDDELLLGTKAWPLSPGDGDRTVHVRFTDANGNASIASGSVRVDGTLPSTPGGFTATTYNNPRRVVLTWTPSTDNDALMGYRIYVKPQNGSYQNQPTGVGNPCPTSPCSWEHSGVRNKDIYTYYVVSYDAAGNESTETSEKTVRV